MSSKCLEQHNKNQIYREAKHCVRNPHSWWIEAEYFITAIPHREPDDR